MVRDSLAVLWHHTSLRHSGIVLVLSFHAETLVRFVLPSYTFGEADGVGIIQVEKTGIVEELFTVTVQTGTYMHFRR